MKVYEQLYYTNLSKRLEANYNKEIITSERREIRSAFERRAWVGRPPPEIPAKERAT